MQWIDLNMALLLLDEPVASANVDTFLLACMVSHVIVTAAKARSCLLRLQSWCRQGAVVCFATSLFAKFPTS